MKRSIAHGIDQLNSLSGIDESMNQKYIRTMLFLELAIVDFVLRLEFL